MGLSNFPTGAGVLPALVMNTAVTIEILKSLLKSVLEITAGAWTWAAAPSPEAGAAASENAARKKRKRRISITHFKCPRLAGGQAAAECSVCLSKFKEGVEVSELSCKHSFHRQCLEKWFDHHHSTCPLCRSIH